MSWTLRSRFKHLRMLIETKDGCKWNGSDPEFVELVHRSIPYLPPHLRNDMHNFYVLGHGRERDENGLFTKESALYYQNVRAGRAALSFLIRLTEGDPQNTLGMFKER